MHAFNLVSPFPILFPVELAFRVFFVLNQCPMYTHHSYNFNTQFYTTIQAILTQLILPFLLLLPTF